MLLEEGLLMVVLDMLKIDVSEQVIYWENIQIDEI